jgi:peptide/nickel transport system substrate-binding protein
VATQSIGDSPLSASVTPKRGGTLHVGAVTEIGTLDPQQAALMAERRIYCNVYETLIGVDEQLQLTPRLATGWRWVDDRTLVLQLQEGVTFQDGTAFDAEAVEYNVARYQAPESLRRAEMVSIDRAEALGRHEVALHLCHPDCTVPAQLTEEVGTMLSPAAIEAGTDVGSSPVGAGTGPFEFVEWSRGDRLTLRSRRGYWRGGEDGDPLPYLGEIVFRVAPDFKTMTEWLLGGDIDFATEFLHRDVPRVQADPALAYRTRAGSNFFGVVFNVAAPPFSDPARRIAVAMSLDRAASVQNVFSGLGVVANGPLSPGSWAHDPTLRVFDRPDLEGAAEMTDGFEFTLKCYDTEDAWTSATTIQQRMAKIGITVAIEQCEGRKLNEELSENRFEAALSGFAGGVDPDSLLYPVFHTKGSTNYGRYSNAQVDQLLDRARMIPEQSKRKRLYAHAQRIIVSEAPWAFVKHLLADEVSSARVHNCPLMPDKVTHFAAVWKD